ncbi:MAG: YebC/PmpR family DNA-binding transcriptional regulator [Chloroflexi bacterium]|nr:YebC/PmpR family DNA-binding transcriptional regulator [Chloroflexota bacterium]
MSGHSKWSSIKHQKGVADVKRGQLFTKLAREIIVAVREGGSNPEANFRLRLAVQKARDSNMPLDNIERAIKKGSGTAEGAALAEIVFEGYGPSGAAILVEVVTDNRNRTIQEIRNIFTRGGGSMGESGSVAWLFDSKGLIRVETDNINTDELTLQAIDAGADDVSIEPEYVDIFTKPDQLEKVKEALEQQKVPICSVELVNVPKTPLELEEKAALQTLKLLHKLEELDETRSVCSNVNFSDAILEKYEAQV